jgi:hypothetical protein
MLFRHRLLASDAIAYSIVIKDIRSDGILEKESEVEDRAKDQGFSIPDTAILKALEITRFASVRQIMRMTFIPPTIAFRRLTILLHFVLKRLCWIRHKLSDLLNTLGSSYQRKYRSCLSS